MIASGIGGNGKEPRPEPSTALESAPPTHYGQDGRLGPVVGRTGIPNHPLKKGAHPRRMPPEQFLQCRRVALTKPSHQGLVGRVLCRTRLLFRTPERLRGFHGRPKGYTTARRK